MFETRSRLFGSLSSQHDNRKTFVFKIISNRSHLGHAIDPSMAMGGCILIEKIGTTDLSRMKANNNHLTGTQEFASVGTILI